jgi:glycosyltransferase involved in cell wall biosynthesis
MKLLVFAHVPPPHHGQSYAVKLMLDNFGGNRRKSKFRNQPPNPFGIECYHVNARFSKTLEDIGEFQGGKIFLILFYCLQAIWCRFRYGVTNFYYVPAPGKRVALYRDWLVMLLCRPFFKHVILHWHAAGLAKWLETSVQIRARATTYHLFRPVDLSLVLSRHNYADAEKLLSRKICLVPNGIPDPCPDFRESVLPLRRSRREARGKLLAGQLLSPAERAAAGGDPEIGKVLFMAHCMREKGLFDALEGVVLASARLMQAHSPLRLQLFVAGEFVHPDERKAFELRVSQLQSYGPGQTHVEYLGFIDGETKRRVLTGSDCFCFPTYYNAESFGLVVTEAMAFGLPVVASRWRSLPEVLPPDYPGLVAIRSPQEIATALIASLSEPTGEILRERFLAHFTAERHLAALAAALRGVEE